MSPHKGKKGQLCAFNRVRGEHGWTSRPNPSPVHHKGQAQAAIPRTGHPRQQLGSVVGDSLAVFGGCNVYPKTTIRQLHIISVRLKLSLRDRTSLSTFHMCSSTRFCGSARSHDCGGFENRGAVRRPRSMVRSNLVLSPEQTPRRNRKLNERKPQIGVKLQGGAAVEE